jgi:hypothetical protein
VPLPLENATPSGVSHSASITSGRKDNGPEPEEKLNLVDFDVKASAAQTRGCNVLGATQFFDGTEYNFDELDPASSFKE